MKRIALLVLAAAFVAGSIGCDGGETASTPYGGALGQGTAPLAPSAPDPGILADASQYQPAKLPTGGAPGAKPGGGGSSGADAGPAEIVQYLVGTIRDVDALLALSAFEPAQVAALSKDKLDPIFATLELVGELADELDDTVESKILGGLRGATEKPKVDTLDAQNASAKPNVARILFGPKAGGDTLKLKKGPQGWKVQLDAPLTDADVEAISAFHKKLQEALTQMLDWTRATKPLDEAKLTDAAAKALQGEAIDLPAAGGDKTAPDSDKSAPEKREEERRP